MRCCIRPFHLLLCGLWFVLGHGWAQDDAQPSEYAIKAAFLFNFAKFTEWPPAAFPDKAAPLVIGTLGGNPFGGALERTLKGKTLNNRPLEIKEFTSAEQATNCHILFISTAEAARMPEIIKRLGARSVLTLGESNAFAEAGGMIRFFSEDNKIRFQINDQAARAAGLKINSKLLNLASQPKR